MEGSGVLKDSAAAGGLDGVLTDGAGWLEDDDVGLSSTLLSGGVRGGVGRPAMDEEEEEVEEEEGSLTAPLRDGFLSWTCCFCCTASSCLRSDTQIKDVSSAVNYNKLRSLWLETREEENALCNLCLAGLWSATETEVKSLCQ